ncbi:hypothetical protein [Streptomyces sulphureus]|uniref:hypothetical protein n=1 Tax=Streptomyces sulphureus TaxID=47758 RepID=UPI0003809362|nr:hypothetical protein [Streptomyces sulphureus]
MTSSREDTADPTGAPPAHTQVHRRRDDRYLDGLFTYCLSVVCEHEPAVSALGEALALAHRRRERGRAPAEPALYRAWLYALARWSCTYRLAAAREPEGPALTGEARAHRRRQLAALAWPEASGQTPVERDALELAVRHGLGAREVAAVLSLDTQEASALVSHASCEVERTRAALAVVESGGCPAVTGLAGDEQLLLGTPLRRELVLHIDDCGRCRRAAERAMSGVRWPGTAPTGARLAVLEAPRADIDAAVEAALHARSRRLPRFDRAGFPVADREREARRERLRGRAVTTTVVVAVLAAPVLTLWAAWRDTSDTVESSGPGSSSELHDRDIPYEKAGQAAPQRSKKADGDHRVSVAVTHPAGDSRLATRAEPRGDGVVLTLTALGGEPVHWSVSTEADWLRIVPPHGVLEPGDDVTVRVTVDASRAPSGRWSTRLAVAPSGAVVSIAGSGSTAAPGAKPHRPSPGRPDTSPSGPSSPAGPPRPPTDPRPPDDSEDPESPGEPQDPESPGEPEEPSEPPPSTPPPSSTQPSTLPAR